MMRTRVSEEPRRPGMESRLDMEGPPRPLRALKINRRILELMRWCRRSPSVEVTWDLSLVSAAC